MSGRLPLPSPPQLIEDNVSPLTGHLTFGFGSKMTRMKTSSNTMSLIKMKPSPISQNNRSVSDGNLAIGRETPRQSSSETSTARMVMLCQQLHNSYEELLKSAGKKEKLERAIRYKLEIELWKLQGQYKDLRDEYEDTLASVAHNKNMCEATSNEENEIQKRDLLIAQLLQQNKELLREKETQEYELQAQRLTLEEQRKHIEILDSALMYAQNNVLKLEGDLRKNQAYEERANHLQKALANLQLASDRRLQMEKRVRTHLEQEIDSLKQQVNGKDSSNSSLPSSTEFEELNRTIREYEQKIMLGIPGNEESRSILKSLHSEIWKSVAK
ncbi:Angiomotin-like protein 1 [Halotydeus destructor]|nr:Angiomotin-like protein 1 [Halotydeus destructor]